MSESLESYLRTHQVDARIIQVPGDAPTSQLAADLLGVSLSAIVKTLLVTDGKQFAAVVMPGDKRLDTKALRKLLGSGNLEFASPALVLEKTGYPAGGVAPVGLRTAQGEALAPVFIEDSLTANPEAIVFGGGGRPELLLEIRVKDIQALSQTKTASLEKLAVSK